MATMPMKTMIAEKITLLMVIGSHVSEELLPWGKFGVVAGSFGSAMVFDDERHSEAIRVCLAQGCLRGIYGTRLATSGSPCYRELDFVFWGIRTRKGLSTYLYENFIKRQNHAVAGSRCCSAMFDGH
jgi:hypothetical protein